MLKKMLASRKGKATKQPSPPRSHSPTSDESDSDDQTLQEALRRSVRETHRAPGESSRPTEEPPQEQISAPPNPYGIKWVRPKHAEKYAEFIKNNRKIEPSRYLDVKLMTDMGIHEQAQALLQHLNLWDFLNTPYDTYYSITVEFLCSVTFPSWRQETISYYFHGQQFVINAATLNHVMGWPNGTIGEFRHWNPFEEYDNFFESITGRRYHPKYKKTSLIQHPMLRYVQRVLACTIFGRGETMSTINQTEMYFLLYMLCFNAANAQPNLIPNVALAFMQNVYTVARKQTKGPVTIGGLITKLYRHHFPDRELHETDKVRGKTRLDVESLMQQHILFNKKEKTPPYSLRGHDDQKTRLPLNQPFEFTDRTTWLIYAPNEIGRQPPQPQPQPAQPAEPQQVNQPAPVDFGPIFSRLDAMQIYWTDQWTHLNSRLDTFQNTQNEMRTTQLAMQQQLNNLRAAQDEYESDAPSNREDLMDDEPSGGGQN